MQIQNRSKQSINERHVYKMNIIIQIRKLGSSIINTRGSVKITDRVTQNADSNHWTCERDDPNRNRRQLPWWRLWAKGYDPRRWWGNLPKRRHCSGFLQIHTLFRWEARLAIPPHPPESERRQGAPSWSHGAC